MDRDGKMTGIECHALDRYKVHLSPINHAQLSWRLPLRIPEVSDSETCKVSVLYMDKVLKTYC